MDDHMKQLQQSLTELEIEAEHLLLTRHQLVEIDRLRNGNREALTALRKRAQTTRTSVPSPFESIMKEIEGLGSKPLVKEICTTCGNHDPNEKTMMMFPGTDVFASIPFHAAHTIVEKDQERLDFESKKLQSYVKEKSFLISESGALADKISPGVLRVWFCDPTPSGFQLSAPPAMADPSGVSASSSTISVPSCLDSVFPSASPFPGGVDIPFQNLPQPSSLPQPIPNDPSGGPFPPSFPSLPNSSELGGPKGDRLPLPRNLEGRKNMKSAVNVPRVMQHPSPNLPPGFAVDSVSASSKQPMAPNLSMKPAASPPPASWSSVVVPVKEVLPVSNSFAALQEGEMESKYHINSEIILSDEMNDDPNGKDSPGVESKTKENQAMSQQHPDSGAPSVDSYPEGIGCLSTGGRDSPLEDQEPLT
ncbi:hypothetical protein Nepgr_033106 [Nepenthes gracilis]|uniref:P53 and DNA damage-regulated protein 1 n=1 Tax=Nepenthes gracilis TaxID=150966 RepID=A0AAD3TJX1_NEPGR|nr:hypothetical protein Nepgr_033106 [Nepenthes gracilis]